MVLGAIVGVGFLILMILLAIAIVPSVFAGLIDNVTGFFTATELLPTVGGNETICDLRIKTIAFLDQRGILGETIFVSISNAKPIEFQYFDCFSQATFPTSALIDFGAKNPDPLAFITLGGEKIHGEIVLRDKNDPTQKVDAFTQPQMRRSITISEGAGIIATPLDISIEFVVTNIPLREYTLEIYYGRQINNLDAGEPLITTISGN